MADGVGAGRRGNRHGYWLLKIGVFCATWLWEEDELCCEESRFGMGLNSKKMEDGSAVSHSTRSQLQRRCVFFGGCSGFNEH